MSRATLIRRAAAWTSTFVMASFGFTSVASAQTITNTGPGSTNRISTSVNQDCTVRNTNNVTPYNTNSQTANTGNATVSNNTSTGMSWGGWDALSPMTAQADGMGYGSWNTGVANWIGQRAGGSGWNSSNSNLSWTPSGSDWDAWNPMTWQTNGQSFGNWYNGVESYLDGNSSAWLLGWSPEATGTGSFGGGASTGNATNSNNANFSITINNAASTAAGTNECGQSNFTAPATGGMGGGGWAPSATAPSVTTASNTGDQGGAGSSNGSSYSVPQPHTQSTMPTGQSQGQQTSVPAPTTYDPGIGGSSMPSMSPSSPSAPSGGNNASISNTGPGSTNTITSTYSSTSTITNNNTVNATNTNSQNASSGNSTVSGNTSAGGSSSGWSGNGNGSSFDAGLVN